jgi:hypothetical protein
VYFDKLFLTNVAKIEIVLKLKNFTFPSIFLILLKYICFDSKSIKS